MANIWDHVKSWIHRKEAEKFTTNNAGDTAVRTTSTLVSPDGDEVSVQHPLPTDGDSVYEKDLNLTISDNFNFSGTVADYFNSLETINTDITANNPKQIKLWFKRSVYASAIGLGCNDLGESFSNIKINLLGSGEVVRETIDLSADNTKYNSKLVQFSPAAFNGILIEFATTDTICLSNITIRKEVKVVAQIEALQDDGTVIELTATDSGNLKVSNAEDGLAIAKGDVIGTTFVHKFGNAENLNTTDGFVDIWDGASDPIAQKTYVFSITDAIDTISSSDNGDTQDVEIQGLDINYDLVLQTVTLTGQTKALLSTPLLRIFRMKNIGTVDIAGHAYCYEDTPIVAGVPTDTTKIRAVINDGNNQTLMAIYTIPAGKTGYMRQLYATISKNKLNVVAQQKLRIRPFGQVFQMKFTGSLSSSGTSVSYKDYVEPEVIPEKSDIIISSDTSVNDLGVAAGFDIVLVDN